MLTWRKEKVNIGDMYTKVAHEEPSVLLKSVKESSAMLSQKFVDIMDVARPDALPFSVLNNAEAFVMNSIVHVGQCLKGVEESGNTLNAPQALEVSEFFSDCRVYHDFLGDAGYPHSVILDGDREISAFDGWEESGLRSLFILVKPEEKLDYIVALKMIENKSWSDEFKAEILNISHDSKGNRMECIFEA